MGRATYIGWDTGRKAADILKDLTGRKVGIILIGGGRRLFPMAHSLNK